MQSIHYYRYGGPEEMGLEEVETLTPGRGQVRVRVRAAATNPADWSIRAGHLRLVSGSRFPRGLGHDFAGVVDAIGPQVTRLKVGDEVLGITGIREAGAFADYLVIAEQRAFPKPPSLSFEQAAALPMAGVTAWSAVVDRAKLLARPIGLHHRMSRRRGTRGGADCSHARGRGRRQLQRVRTRGSVGAGRARGRRLPRLRPRCLSAPLRPGLRHGQRCCRCASAAPCSNATALRCTSSSGQTS